VRSYGTFDPVSDVRREFENTQYQIENAVAEKPAAESAGAAPAIETATPPVASATDAAPSSAPAPSSNAAPPESAPAPTPAGESVTGGHAGEGKPT
jgi:hypothetical protein